MSARPGTAVSALLEKRRIPAQFPGCPLALPVTVLPLMGGAVWRCRGSATIGSTTMSAKKEATPRTKTDAATKGTTAKKARAAKERKSADRKSGKLSALDAAARVLGEEGRAMNCKELIETRRPRTTGSRRPVRRP